MKERIHKIKEKMRTEHPNKQQTNKMPKGQENRRITNEVIKGPENEKTVLIKEKMIVASNQTAEKVQEGLPVLTRKIVAEFLGTYFFVFAGTGALILDYITGDLTHFGVSITFGLAFMIAIFTFGHLSGAHFNPAITIGFLIRKDIDYIEAVSYIITQILGAITASFTLYMMFGNVLDLGATHLIGTEVQTFALEFILTFFLMMVVLGTVYGKQSRMHGGISIGAVVFFATFFGSSLTGASLNPARSIGPAVVSGATEGLWVYIVATVLGAVAATLISKLMNE